MEKNKRNISFLLVVFILMNHLIPFIHSFEHKDDFTNISSNELKFDQNSDINEYCCFCDIYFNLNYSQFQSLSYSLVVPTYISNCILDTEKQFSAVVLYRKKSRAPPFFLA